MKLMLNASIIIVLLSLGMVNLITNPFGSLARADESPCVGEPQEENCFCCEEIQEWICGEGS